MHTGRRRAVVGAATARTRPRASGPGPERLAVSCVYARERALGGRWTMASEGERVADDVAASERGLHVDG